MAYSPTIALMHLLRAIEKDQELTTEKLREYLVDLINIVIEVGEDG